MLVSHWSVDSAATVKLITHAVGATTRDKTLGRAESLRRAMLTMIDNRSGVQLAAAEGTAKNTDFALFGSAYGWAGAGGAGGYSSTPEGKIIIAAFADSYNQLVKVVRNYRAQTVKGGLGTGGALGVQGGSTPASPR